MVSGPQNQAKERAGLNKCETSARLQDLTDSNTATACHIAPAGSSLTTRDVLEYPPFC